LCDYTKEREFLQDYKFLLFEIITVQGSTIVNIASYGLLIVRVVPNVFVVDSDKTTDLYTSHGTTNEWCCNWSNVRLAVDEGHPHIAGPYTYLQALMLGIREL
jgi:hypothetical protein